MSTAFSNPPAVAEAATTSGSRPAAVLPLWQRAIVFGTGFGIAIGERNLEAAIVRARPAGATLVSSTTIADFRNRPAAEWGAALLKCVAAAGETRLAATVLLPRSEVIVRTLSLPGVADKDIASAIELQIDTLHPWGDAEVAWGWRRAGADVLIGLTRREVLDSCETLFAEAGIPLAAVTFAPAVIYAALRIWSAGPTSVLCFHTDEAGRTEVYGESAARSVYSAAFGLPSERALALARAELRMPADTPAQPLAAILPVGGRSADELRSSESGDELRSFKAGDELRSSGQAEACSHMGLGVAAAVAASAPRAARFANLLPAERRASHNRMQYAIPAALAVLLAMALMTAFVIFPLIEQRRYRNELDRAARQLEPKALRAQELERKVKAERSRILALDQIRRRPQDDLDVLNELTRLLPPPVWTSSIEIYPDSVVIAGEADQAEPLLKVLDSSPLFQNSEFSLSVTRTGQTETFRIKTMRRGRAGRTTP